MSGGINSSLAAVLLKQVKYDVIGISIEFTNTNLKKIASIFDDESTLPGNIFSARSNAAKYKIPHKILRVEENFFTEIKKILDSGKTEQADDKSRINAVFTWQLMKQLVESSKILGCQRLVTGHYARIKRNENGIFSVAEGFDKDKDESSKLSLLTQDLLGFVMFPLGEYHWGAVERMATQYNLAVI